VLAIAASLSVVGCRNSGNTFDMSRHAAKWAAAKASARQELIQIPPPLKSVYLNINQEQQWQNPFLSVERNMIQIRIYLPDENASPIDRGGITRLSAARKQVVNVRLAELPRALASLPNGAWPYGRVVAIGREKVTPQNRAWFPNHLDITVRALQDMGVVVDDWNHPAALP
jgi:hypothetical protein